MDELAKEGSEKEHTDAINPHEFATKALQLLLGCRKSNAMFLCIKY